MNNKLTDKVIIADILKELEFARNKFPNTRHIYTALCEEVGEVANALLEVEYGNKEHIDVYKEAVQVACMAIRLAVEGDSTFLYDPDAIMRTKNEN